MLLPLAEGSEQALCVSWAGSRNVSKCDMELPSVGMEHPSLLSCQEPLSLLRMGQDSWVRMLYLGLVPGTALEKAKPELWWETAPIFHTVSWKHSPGGGHWHTALQDRHCMAMHPGLDLVLVKTVPRQQRAEQCNAAGSPCSSFPSNTGLCQTLSVQ